MEFNERLEIEMVSLLPEAKAILGVTSLRLMVEVSDCFSTLRCFSSSHLDLSVLGWNLVLLGKGTLTCLLGCNSLFLKGRDDAWISPCPDFVAFPLDFFLF